MALATRLLQVVRDVAAELEVSAEVLATRKDIEAIAFGSGAPDDSPLMRGWRRDVVGEKLLAALA
jgi:ribonuclease D